MWEAGRQAARRAGRHADAETRLRSPGPAAGCVSLAGAQKAAEHVVVCDAGRSESYDSRSRLRSVLAASGVFLCAPVQSLGCDPTGRLSLMPTSSLNGPGLSERTHPTPLAAFLPPSPPPPAAAPPAATPAAQQVQQGSAATGGGDRLSECAAGWTGVQQPLEYHLHAIRKGSLITASGVSTSSRRVFQPAGHLPPVQHPAAPAKRTCSSETPHAARHSASSAAPIAAILPSDSFTLEAPVCRWDAEAWVGSVVGSLPAGLVTANRNRVAAAKAPLAE